MTQTLSNKGLFLLFIQLFIYGCGSGIQVWDDSNEVQLAAPTLSVQSNQNKLRLEWKAIQHAKGYELQKDGGSWIDLGSTLSFTDDKVSTVVWLNAKLNADQVAHRQKALIRVVDEQTRQGSKHSYVVRAYSGRWKSDSSNTIETGLEQPLPKYTYEFSESSRGPWRLLSDLNTPNATDSTIPLDGAPRFYRARISQGHAEYITRPTQLIRPFVTQWKGREITTPAGHGDFQYDVDWNGDGIYDEHGLTTSVTRTFSDDNHIVAIRGTFPHVHIGIAPTMIGVLQWGDTQWHSFSHSYRNINSRQKQCITFNTLDVPDLRLVEGMSRAFEGQCHEINRLENWDVSNVKDMSGMFMNADFVKPNVEAWDVSNVTDMSYMFSGIWSLETNLEKWDVSNVTDMSHMFDGAGDFNQDLSKWDVSNVTNMSHMFDGATNFNQNIGTWDVSNVTDTSYMFAYAKKFNQDLSKWDVSHVTNMSHMFEEAKQFNHNIGAWNTAHVWNMSWMFSGVNNFSQDLSMWDVSNVTDMSHMFKDVWSLKTGLENWDVSKVRDMSGMFFGATNFNQDISGWDVSNVTKMVGMFEGAQYFNQNISAWDVSRVRDMSWMFAGAVFFDQDLSKWDVSSVTDMSHMFEAATNFNQDLSDWDVSGVADMSYMFANAARFDQDLGKWDIANITKSFGMFYMLSDSNLSTSNYDKTLSGWANQPIQKHIFLGARGLRYCNLQARTMLVDSHFWSIEGDVLAETCQTTQ